MLGINGIKEKISSLEDGEEVSLFVVCVDENGNYDRPIPKHVKTLVIMEPEDLKIM